MMRELRWTEKPKYSQIVRIHFRDSNAPAIDVLASTLRAFAWPDAQRIEVLQ